MKIKFGLHEILSRISEPSAVFEADFEKQTQILHRFVHEPTRPRRDSPCPVLTPMSAGSRVRLTAGGFPPITAAPVRKHGPTPARANT